MSKDLEEYIKDIPEDFELLLKALGHKIRIDLIFQLYKNKNLSLSKLGSILDLENGLVLNHLKTLELAGVVQNYLLKSEETREFSFYELTKFGMRFVIDLQESFLLHQSEALKAVSNKFRFALSSLLRERGPYTFTKIIEITKMNKSVLSNHLQKLELGGMIQNYFKKVEKSNEYSYYEITDFGAKLISCLLESYNGYYSGIDTKKHEEIDIKAEDYFKADCNKWALPNEKILVWIELFSTKISKIEIKLTPNLKIKSFYNIIHTFDESNNIISLYNENINLYYIPFELVSKVPSGDNSVNLESLIISVYDSKLSKISEKQLKIDILKPIVRLKVKNRQYSSNNGLFEINISCLKDFQISIDNIEIDVKDDNNNLIPIEIDKKDPIEFEQDIPPEIKLDKLIGQFIMNGRGVFNFHFKVQYRDVLNNLYYSNEEIITLSNIEEFKANFDYIYNYSVETAQT